MNRSRIHHAIELSEEFFDKIGNFEDFYDVIDKASRLTDEELIIFLHRLGEEIFCLLPFQMEEK